MKIINVFGFKNINNINKFMNQLDLIILIITLLIFNNILLLIVPATM